MPQLPSLVLLSLLLLSLLLLSHLPLASCQSFLSNASLATSVPLSAFNSTDSFSFTLSFIPPSTPHASVVITSSAAGITAQTTSPTPTFISSASHPPYLASVLVIGATLCPHSACVVNVTLYPYLPLPSTMTYSLYPYTPLTLGLNTGHIADGAFAYFLYDATSTYLPLNLSLSISTPSYLDVASSSDAAGSADLLLPYLTPRLSASYDVLISATGLYLIGVQPVGGGGGVGSSSQASTAYNLTLTPHASPSGSPPSSPTPSQIGDGRPVNASEGFILAITVIVVICPIFLLCCLLIRAWHHKRRMSRQSVATRSTAEREMRRRWMLEDVREQHRGLTEAEIEALPVRIYRKEGEEERRVGVLGVGVEEPEGEAERCSICLDEYEDGRSVVKGMKCGHFWHASCIEQWLRQGPTHCPLCLQRFDRAQNLAKRAPHRVEEVELIDLRAAPLTHALESPASAAVGPAEDASASSAAAEEPPVDPPTPVAVIEADEQLQADQDVQQDVEARRSGSLSNTAP